MDQKRAGVSTDTAYEELTKTNVVQLTTTGRNPRTTTDKGVTLNRTTAKTLALPSGRNDFVYWDSQLKGFGLRILGLRKSWVIQFRDRTGTSRRVTLGSVEVLDAEQARVRAKKQLADALVGSDPAAAKRQARAAIRMADLVDEFLAYAGDRQKPATHSMTTRNLKLHAKILHKLGVKQIERADVARMHEAVTAKNGRIAANRALASLSGFFGWTIGKGYRNDNPAAFVPKNAAVTRSRHLSDAEIQAVWRGTATGSDFDRIVRLLLATGARRTEVGSMEWDEITDGPSGRTWNIPGERMKNSEHHSVPLTNLALAQLPERTGDAPFVFGKTEDAGYSGWSRSKARLDHRLKLPDWHLHDMRRTVSTRLHEAGVAPHIVEAILAHVGHKQGVGGIYNKALYDQPKRNALELWAKLLAEIVDG